MYYTAKLKWKQPKEGSDEDQKVSKSFLVKAVSITDVEAKITSWIPANYKDWEIVGVQEWKLVDIIIENDSEVFWEAKLADENNDTGKLTSFLVAINGGNHMEVIKKLNEKYSMSEFLAIKKTNTIIDEDLITDEVLVPRKIEMSEEDIAF